MVFRASHTVRLSRAFEKGARHVGQAFWGRRETHARHTECPQASMSGCWGMMSALKVVKHSGQSREDGGAVGPLFMTQLAGMAEGWE